jgi:hypothetical protein
MDTTEMRGRSRKAIHKRAGEKQENEVIIAKQEGNVVIHRLSGKEDGMLAFRQMATERVVLIFHFLNVFLMKERLEHTSNTLRTHIGGNSAKSARKIKYYKLFLYK